MASSSCSPRMLLSSTSRTSVTSISAPINASSRCLSTTSSNLKPRRNQNQNDPFSLRRMPSFAYDDIPSVGHKLLREEANLLKYHRIAELELPKLQAFTQPFTPPPSTHFLRLRSLHYQGEPHPVSRKSVLTFSVSDLFSSGILSSNLERKRFLLLAGVRWDPFSRLDSKIKNERKRAQLGWYREKSRDLARDHNEVEAGVEGEEWNENKILEKGQGLIKISCERFPNREQNSKWCVDRLMELIKEAKNPSTETDFASLPLDPRAHLSRQEKRNTFARTSGLGKKDFPKEWL